MIYIFCCRIIGLYKWSFVCLFIFMEVLLFSNGTTTASCDICGLPDQRPKIMNGTSVPIMKYPWIVSIKSQGSENFCTGAIIAAKYILTAAHCLENLETSDDKSCQSSNMKKYCYMSSNDLEIMVQGRKRPINMAIKRLIPHPEYSSQTVDNDIALVKLRRAINCRQPPKPLCLPNKDLSNEGQKLIIAGYGLYTKNLKDTSQLKEGEVVEVLRTECNHYKESDGKKKLCARGEKTQQASCEGDSGSSIFKQVDGIYYVVGLTSVGPPDCSSARGDSYTNVYYHMDWIKKRVKNLPSPPKDLKN